MKIALLGPIETGKSTIADIISYNEKSTTTLNKLQKRYIPTKGCRIVEIEVMNKKIELWDVSGCHDYENCWPAIIDGLDAVIFVYDPENPLHEDEIQLWYDAFLSNTSNSMNKNKNCLVLLNSKNAGVGSNKIHQPDALQGSTFERVHHSTPSKIQDIFNSFIRMLNTH